MQAASITAAKPRKRDRQFILEMRNVPSTIGSAFGKTHSQWYELTRAKKLAHLSECDTTDKPPGIFAPGTEYRVRREDRKVAA